MSTISRHAAVNMFVPTPQAQTYTYANNPWRGDQAACDGAKLAPASHFYDYAALKRCYGYP